MSKIKRLIVIVISLTLLSTSVFAGNAAIHLDKAVSPKGGEIITLPVTLFQQETGYYCGPASVQMVVNYLSAYVEQDDLASDLGCFGGGGTNVDKVLPCLNKYLGSGYYEECRTYGGDNIAGLIPLSINNGNPVICNVETRYLPYYNGHSSRHYVVVYGHKWAQGGSGSGGIQEVYINDPNNQSAYYGSFDCTMSEMQDALDGNAGYFWISRK